MVDPDIDPDYEYEILRVSKNGKEVDSIDNKDVI